MDDNGFIERLQSLMARKSSKGKKFTSYHIAKKVEGISSTAIDKYLNGSLTPGPEKVKLLADFFKVSPGWLMFGEEPNATTFSSDKITVSTAEMWDVLKASVYNQNAQNDHIGKLLDLLQEKMGVDKKETAACVAV
jgi:transcriptional regulator with XRE-family HTH domain